MVNAQARDQTHNLMIGSPSLYQLSYSCGIIQEILIKMFITGEISEQLYTLLGTLFSLQVTNITKTCHCNCPIT